MKCWICGAPADTGEHRVKKSDLKMVFTNVSQRQPVYGRGKSRKVERIGSLKSDKFKSEAKLCHHCNTARTQPFDFAWEQLSTYLRTDMVQIENQGRLKVEGLFPGSARTSMLDVHLYFVKIFGCLLSEHAVPVDLKPFADCILSRKAHPRIYLGFGFLQKKHEKNLVMITPIEVCSKGTSTEFLSWQYIIQNVFVDITWTKEKHYMKAVKGFWHPRNLQKNIKLSGLRFSL